MKINLELEVGMESGVVAGALQELIKNLKDAKNIRGDTSDSAVLTCAIRIHQEIEDKVFWG